MVVFKKVNLQDGHALAEIRAVAMKPSLIALGRYDEQKVRRRFLDSFVPKDTQKILVGDALAGFFVVRDKLDHLYLDHLYIHPDYQKQKLGRAVIEHLAHIAKTRCLAIRLGALRNSPANQFYINHDFIKIAEDDFDIFYELKS